MMEKFIKAKRLFEDDSDSETTKDSVIDISSDESGISWSISEKWDSDWVYRYRRYDQKDWNGGGVQPEIYSRKNNDI